MSEPNKKTAAILAQQFKKKAVKTKPLSPSAIVQLPIPGVSLEDGSPFIFECELRRVDLGMMYAGGHVPEHLAKALLSVNQWNERNPEQVKDVASELTPENMGELFSHQIRIAQFSCVAPKLVYHEPKDESEIDLREVEFAGQIITAIYVYATNGAPDVPVSTADGGETTLKAVETFRDGEQGAESVDAGDRSAESEPISRAADGTSG